MENTVENSQIKEFTANLKGRKPTRKKRKLNQFSIILKTMGLIKSQMICRNLLIFVRLLTSKYGAKVKLKQSPLLIVGAVDSKI